MDFTEIYRQSSSLVTFSPGANFILTTIQGRVIVRRTDTFQITRTWLVDSTQNPTQAAIFSSRSKQGKSYTATTASLSDLEHTITHTGWSCDSEYILAACAKQGAVHLLKLRDEEWSGRIDAGAEAPGLVSAEWTPDGRTVLCFSEWGLRVSLWSITTGTATYIQFPIHPDRGYAFRTDGRYFILAERHKSKDTLGVYDASEGYRLVRHFPLPTSSFASLALSPTGNHVALWEGPLEYKLHVVTLAGDRLTTYSPALDPGFGIRKVSWHPSGVFLAVAGWDDKIHILDSFSWSEVFTLESSSRLPSHVNVWREPSKWLETTEGRGFLTYEHLQGPQTLNSLRVDLTKPHPKSGVVQLDWNLTGTLLLARFENIPNAVFLFDFPSAGETNPPKLRSLLLHSQPVLHCRWNPVRKGSLCLCCGIQSVYTWSDEWQGESGEEEEMAECIGVPAKKFETKDIRWAPDGKGFILLGKDQFCCAFEVLDEAVEMQNTPLMKLGYKTFTTSRGFTYSYHRSPAALNTLDLPNPPLPALLFLHGFPTSALIWKQQIKYFGDQGFVVIAPDLLGLGGTSKPSDQNAYRASLICQDIIELLDSEGVQDNQVIAIGHDQGSRILSRLANFYPNRCRAYAFLADPYHPPRPMTNVDYTLTMTKKMIGYELRGYSLFYAEDGADKLIETHLDSFFSVLFPKDPKLWATEMAPVGALKSWLEQDKTADLAPYIDPEDLHVWHTTIAQGGIGAALCYHKAYVSGLNADDDKAIPLDKYVVEKPVFFAAANHDYISRALLAISQSKHHCENITIREFNDGHWLMMSSGSEINAALFFWIMDCVYCTNPTNCSAQVTSDAFEQLKQLFEAPMEV